MPQKPFTIDEQIECVDREYKLRMRVYPRWIRTGKLTQSAADIEILKLQAVRDTLVRVKTGDLVPRAPSLI